MLTGLIAAAYNGHAEAVKVLVQQYDNGVHDFMVAARNNSQWFGDKAKRTLVEVLQKLAQEGSTPVLQKLINAEAGKIKDAQGNTALMAAVRNGHVEAAKVLVQQYDNGVHELMAAARENSESGRNAKETLLRVLQELAQEGSTAILQKLIKAGAGKMKDARGKTALMRSVEMMESDGERGLQALKALLDAGADISIQDADNQTVMHHATVLANREHDANSAAYTAAVAALAQAADKKKKFADIWSLWR